MKNSAKILLSTHNLKYSKQREQVIDELSKHKQPLSVEDLYDSLKKDGVSINLSTIYRTIEALSNHNIVEKVYSSITNSHLIQLAHHHHQHYLVCISCHKMIPIDYCPMEALLGHINSNYDFEVVSHQLEISGYCQQCRN